MIKAAGNDISILTLEKGSKVNVNFLIFMPLTKKALFNKELF